MIFDHPRSPQLLHTYAHSDDVGTPTLKCLLLAAWHRPPLCIVTAELRPCRPEVGTLLVCPSEHFDMAVPAGTMPSSALKHSCLYEQIHSGSATLVLHSEELTGNFMLPSHILSWDGRWLAS